WGLWQHKFAGDTMFAELGTSPRSVASSISANHTRQQTAIAGQLHPRSLATSACAQSRVAVGSRPSHGRRHQQAGWTEPGQAAAGGWHTGFVGALSVIDAGFLAVLAGGSVLLWIGSWLARRRRWRRVL